MKNNLKVANVVMSGKIPLNKKITFDQFERLIEKFGWEEVSPGENYSSRFSKTFCVRKQKELSVRSKIKNPYCTIFALGGIIIVGLKSKKEGNIVYDLVIEDLKKARIIKNA